MSEPVSTTLPVTGLLAGGLGLAGYWHGVDGNALIGAFAGAALFAMHRKEPPRLVRGLHFCVSAAIGYLAAPELARRLPLEETGVCAALGAACAVTVLSALIDSLDKCDLVSLWQRVRGSKRDVTK